MPKCMNVGALRTRRQILRREELEKGKKGVCHSPGCCRFVHAKNLCRYHYDQARRIPQQEWPSLEELKSMVRSGAQEEYERTGVNPGWEKPLRFILDRLEEIDPN